jgi:hypothetical protein
MSMLQKIKTIFASYPIVAVFCTWGLIMAVAYPLLILQVAIQTDQAKKGGIDMIQQLSRKMSLPLLEKNTDQLQATLAEAGQKPGVRLAWAVDHQNKVVAFAARDPFGPPARKSDSQAGEVNVWQADESQPAAYISLVSPITYSGTRIGRVFLSLAPDARSDFRAQFVRVMILSGLLVLILMVALYHRQFGALATRISNSRKQNLAAAADLAQSSFACPLCGQARPFSKETFESANVDAQAVVFSAPKGSSRSTPQGGGRGVILNELRSREDLAWIKRRIILRCADIIRVLSN